MNLQIRNLRILQRIKRFIEEMIPRLKGVETKVKEDILRSLILYVWSYYEKGSDAPSLDYILDYSFVNQYISETYKNEDLTAEKKGWNETLSLYNYLHTDDVDKCVAEFVNTGYVDDTTFKDALNKKNEQALAVKSDESYREVWDIYYRNSFDNNEEEFLKELLARFRANMNYLAFSDLQEAVATLRAFDWEAQANSLIDEYFNQRNSEKEIERIKKLENSIFVQDLKDEHLLNRLSEYWEAKAADKRSLGDVLNNTTNGNILYQDVRHLNSFSVEDFYNFFKGEHPTNLYFFVRGCLDLGQYSDAEGLYKSVSEKVKEALGKIASESKINKMRVSRLYGVQVN